MDQTSITAAEAKAHKVSKAERFVEYVITRADQDNGFAARLKRADNPATEYQSWELLASFGVDLEKDWERLPFCTIGAAVARAKPSSNGVLGLGQAIAACYEDGNRSDQAKARLRRVLACTTTSEACRVVRPLLMLMASRGVRPDFSRLLEQLLRYSGDAQGRIRTVWAQDFYHRAPAEVVAELSND